MSRSSSPRLLSALPLCLALLGCGASASQSPEATLDALADALEARDAAAAYALMSRSYRAQVPFETFRARVEHPDDDSVAVIAALREHDGPAEIEAHVTLEGGEVVVLHAEGGTFHVESDVVDYYSQASPRLALRSFVRAAEHQRYDVLLRLMPRRDREGFTEESLRVTWTEQAERMDRIVGVLRAALRAPIEVSFDRAVLDGEGAHAIFVLEGDAWVIEDPE
jgi:hypothetical protein